MEDKIERIKRVMEYVKKNNKNKTIDEMDTNERYMFDLLVESNELTEHICLCYERIHDIYDMAIDEHRKLTDAEREAIASLKEEINETKAMDNEVIGEFFEMVEELWGVS